MKESVIRRIFAIIWLISGSGKILGSVGELVSGQPLLSPYMTMFANECILPVYASIIRSYFVPAAIPLILAASLIEVIVCFLMFSKGNARTVGLILACGLNIVFLPLVGWFTVVINLIFITVQVWLLLKNLKNV